MWNIPKIKIYIVFLFVNFIHGNLIEEIISTTTSNQINATTEPQIPDITATALYYDLCNETVQCTKLSGLYCNQDDANPRCNCRSGTKLDQRRRICVGMLMSKCGIVGDLQLNDNITVGQPEKTEMLESLDCPELAVCSSTRGRCRCRLDLYHDGRFEDTCEPKEGFGRLCKSQEECDSSKMLACVNSKCQAFAKNEMYWDKGAGRFGIKIGGNCRNLSEQFKNITRILKNFPPENDLEKEDYIQWEAEVWRYINETFSTIQCLTGSSCNGTTGRCGFVLDNITGEASCFPRSKAEYSLHSYPEDYPQYMDKAAGTCEFVKDRGQKCVKDKECDSRQLLSCVQGKCGCDPDKTVKNRNSFVIERFRNDIHVPLGHCLGKVGSPCDYDEQKYCIPDAYCSGDGTCGCNRERITQDKMCGNPYNASCSMERACSDYLVCTEEKCLCPNEDYQIHDSEITADGSMGSCRYFVGATCHQQNQNVNATSSTCVTGADCIQEEAGNYVCKCKNGFIANSMKKCDISHGQPCDHKNQPGLRCNKVADLKCRIVRGKNKNSEKRSLKQVCSCRNLNDAYDAGLRKCVQDH